MKDLFWLEVCYNVEDVVLMNSTMVLIVFVILDLQEMQLDNVLENILPQHVVLMNNMITYTKFAYVNQITTELMVNVKSQ